MTVNNPYLGAATARGLTLVAALCALLAASSADARGRCRGDADCDGLSNKQERVLGTDPRSADSDHDGVSDGEEGKMGSDPTNADSDNDGVEDGEEVSNHTDPANADSDGDGTTDGEDQDPKGELEPKLVGPIDSVDVAGKTISMFGCLVIDASSAEIDGDITLNDVVAGAFVTIKLDGSQLPALVAKKIEFEDKDHDGIPDDVEHKEAQ